MRKINQVYLQDMLEAVKTIEEYVEGVGREQFLDEGMRQDAVVRQLMIIGEAANKLSEDFIEKYPDFPLVEAVSMRNMLVHGYDEVDLGIVWDTVQKDLSILKKKLEEIL